jgi:hypothetical protein
MTFVYLLKYIKTEFNLEEAVNFNSLFYLYSIVVLFSKLTYQ